MEDNSFYIPVRYQI